MRTAAHRDSGAAPRRRPKPRGPRTLLVVEDDPVVRGLLAGMLELLGHRAWTAASGEEALEGWPEAADDVAGAILDWTLPGIRGDELARRLRELEPGLPLVLTSGDECLWEGVVAGLGAPVALLPKPFSLAELRRALWAVLG